MRKIKLYSSLLFVSLLTLTGCKDDDLDRLDITKIESGAILRTLSKALPAIDIALARAVAAPENYLKIGAANVDAALGNADNGIFVEDGALALVIGLETPATDGVTANQPGYALELSGTARINGFGGAITDASSEVFAKLPADKQEELLKAYFDKEEGIGYRKISYKLNSWGIKTPRGKKWFNTSVHSVLKRRNQRDNRIDNQRNQRYPIEIGELSIKYYPF